MPAGRPTEGLEHIDRVHGSFEAKHRLKTIVLSLTGDVLVVEACERLRIGASRFHVIRQEALQAAVRRLEPHRAGRPHSEAHASSERVRTLEERLAQSESDLRHERTRAEIALATSYAARMRDRGGQSRSG
jgi:hypothetical protein